MGVVADGFEKHASFEERTRALQVTADAMRASVRIVADAPYGGSVADQFVDLIGRSLDRPCRIVEGPSPDIDGQQDLLLPIPSPTDGQLWLAIESGPRLELADWEMELAQLLAVQLGAALNLQQSTATKQRADELALANRALSRTVYRLASKPDLDAVLGHVLLESSTHLGADAAQLTIYDAERDVLVTAAAAQDGALLDKHELPHEQPRQSCPFFDRLIERGGPSLFDPMREPELFWSDSLDFHRRREHTIVLACPILLDRVILGHIVLAYKNPDDVPDTSSELVNALTTQAGLAIYLTRLADQAQQQAVTAEREQAAVLRAAELSKVSRLLVESLRELSASSDPEEFLEHALRSLAHAIGATNIHLFSYDAERDTLCLRLTYVDGWVRRGPDGSELPLFAAPFPTKVTRAWELMVSDRGLYTLKTTSTPAQDFAWPGAVERLRQIGASDYGHMVLFMGDQPVGSLGLEFTNGRKLSEGDRPLLAALAQQMAIALRLADISKYAREAITARERAHTAQLKVAELTKANEALRLSSEQICSLEHLDRFLDQVLSSCIEITGAVSGAVALVDLEGTELRIIALHTDRPDATGEHPRVIALVGEVGRLWDQLKTSEELSWIKSEDVPDRTQREWHLAREHSVMTHVPLFIRRDQVGFLKLAFRGEHRATEMQLEVVQVLARQSALAVQFTRLAHTSKQAAIARERARHADARAKELSESAAVLRKTSSHLTQGFALSEFVNEVLMEAKNHTGARCATLYRHDARTETLSLVAAVDGGIIQLRTDPRFAQALEPVPVSRKCQWDRLELGEPVAISIMNPDTPACPETAVFLDDMGITDVLTIPISLGSRLLGFFSLGFSSPYADEMKIELLQALAQQTAVAFQLRELLEQSRQSAVIEERANLARELHDTLLQGFTGVTLQLRALLRRPPDSPEETRFRLARIEREATDAVQEARRAVGDMRGGFSLVPVSESEDVVAGIATLVHQARSNTDSDLIWQARGRLRLLDSLATVVILRIAREALGNALRHGKPTRVMITLAFQPAQVELKIEDNGQGFDTSVLPTIGEKHFGIVGMRERAESLGGGIQITSEIGVGTTVVATLPA